MRLTNKTYTDVAHLPLAEAAEILPKFTAKKGTQKWTQESDAAVHVPLFAGANHIGETKDKTIENKEFCHALTSTGAEGQELEMAHPSGVEPETF